ncbi:MAG: radical SAM protein [Syntrophaceae bacterium]|nr:radical SAM protein [Syntrophaceae bacterium]
MDALYLKSYRKGVLRDRVRDAVERLGSCCLCPRHCGVNRLEDEVGVCRTGRLARVASFQSHFGEEAPLVGIGGSGTIFFSSCNLLCSFCQNYEISHLMEGDRVEKEELAGMMLALQRRGCHNINLVSPTHVVPQILEALIPAIEMGLTVPIVYNTGGYDAVETLRLLEGIVDIYMPDFKFWDNCWGERFCHVSDYRERVCAAIREMHRQVGDFEIGADGIARRGLLVRHLVMPGDIAGTEDVMCFLAQEISIETYVNIMAQYHPAGGAMRDPLISRRITRKEYDLAVQAVRKVGLRRLDEG